MSERIQEAPVRGHHVAASMTTTASAPQVALARFDSVVRKPRRLHRDVVPAWAGDSGRHVLKQITRSKVRDDRLERIDAIINVVEPAASRFSCGGHDEARVVSQ